MYENCCTECGGRTLDGEGICDACLSENNGGYCISMGGCPNKAVPGEGFCEEHLRQMRDSYAELYNQMYCRHGVERDLDGCWQCDSDMEYCDRCGAHHTECFCYADGKGAVRPVEQAKLCTEMSRREEDWNYLVQSATMRPFGEVVADWIETLDDIPF